MQERVQKILARMGVASRRKAEELIEAGRVTVNGRVATIGMSADAARDHVKLDGRLLTRPEPFVYYKFFKPARVVTSLNDPEGRSTVLDFLQAMRYRVFPVGRLDYDSEGLLLVTNDGDLAHRVTHPSTEMPKTYLVKVKGLIGDEAVQRLRKGVRLADGPTRPARVRVVERLEQNSWIEVTIHEGRNRQVRRMLEEVGYGVLRLRRTAIGGVKIQDMKPGELRPLSADELAVLREMTGGKKGRKKRATLKDNPAGTKGGSSPGRGLPRP